MYTCYSVHYCFPPPVCSNSASHRVMVDTFWMSTEKNMAATQYKILLFRGRWIINHISFLCNKEGKASWRAHLLLLFVGDHSICGQDTTGGQGYSFNWFICGNGDTQAWQLYLLRTPLTGRPFWPLQGPGSMVVLWAVTVCSSRSVLASWTDR